MPIGRIPPANTRGKEMEAISKDELEAAFRVYQKALTTSGAPGKELVLNYNAAYGGYRVLMIGDESGETLPLGMRRRKKRAMYDALLFAIGTLDYILNIAMSNTR